VPFIPASLIGGALFSTVANGVISPMKSLLKTRRRNCAHLQPIA
jgi:hypothetical protein